MTAKEWLDKEDIVWNYTAIPSMMIKKPELELLLERFGNHRTKELQGLIMQFRQNIDKNPYTAGWTSSLKRDFLYSFDKHFNIEQVNKGKIDERADSKGSSKNSP